MVFHHEHHHGKAFHGLEAREMMEAKKRDSHDDHIKLNIPVDDNKYRFIHVAGKAVEDTGASDENVVTIISQVYVTEPKTFPGPAVYITQTPVTVTNTAPVVPTQNSYESAKSLINQPKTRSSTYQSYPTGESAIKGTPLSHDYISQDSQGMSGGEKAGVAIGVLSCIALVAGLLLFCIRRRKKQLANRGEKLDEKHVSQASFFSGTAAAVSAPAGNKRESVRSTHTAATAPRLSLRPVTQFLPGILESKSNANSQTAPAMSEKQRSVSPQNPFADANPFEDGDGKASNHSSKPSWESGEVGTAAAVPIGAAGAGAKNESKNVHRVQLDFKPSMEDEIELKSGQLVRMLHEYDDGWALCMRMDRTQQGVCPRTCLSKLPVKPRPQGPPQGRGSPPGFRGPPPQGPNKMMPRPLTPTGRERSNTARSASPTPQDSSRVRSQSLSATERAVSPIDQGVPARKPVPGQAT